VPLPGQSQQETKTVVLDRDRTDPVPSGGGSEAATPTPRSGQPVIEQDARTDPVVAQPAAKPVVAEPAPEKPAPKPAVATSSATGMWAVQLGSFSDQENAERLAADLRKQGFAAFLSQLSTASGQLHRVRIGPQKDRESAEAMAARLKKAGYDGKVLPHP
jgi:DedD protein